MAHDEAAEEASRLGLLHLQQLAHLRIALLELELPVHETAVELLPLIETEAVAQLHADLGELLAVVHRRSLTDDVALVEVLLQREQQLAGIDGLDEVVRDLAADGLVHQLLLLALGHHDDGDEGAQLLDPLQCVQPREARHVLVEEDEVEVLRLHRIDGFVATQYGRYLVALILQKEDVGLEQVDLIVCPEDLIYFVAAHTLRR